MNLKRFVLCFLLVSLSTSLASAAKYAVLVGVEQYQHSQLREPRLQFPIEDVTELGALLQKAGYQVTLLTDDTGKRDKTLLPTRANIDARIKSVLRKCGPEDTVILAFAGHGL